MDDILDLIKNDLVNEDKSDSGGSNSDCEKEQEEAKTAKPIKENKRKLSLEQKEGKTDTFENSLSLELNNWNFDKKLPKSHKHYEGMKGDHGKPIQNNNYSRSQGLKKTKNYLNIFRFNESSF